MKDLLTNVLPLIDQGHDLGTAEGTELCHQSLDLSDILRLLRAFPRPLNFILIADSVQHNAGPPGTNYAWRSSPGSNAPTTADAANDASATHTHRIRDTQPARTRGLTHPPRESTNPGQSPSSPAEDRFGWRVAVGVEVEPVGDLVV